MTGRRLLWALVILGVLAGGFVLFATLTIAKGAPQEAAGAAVAVALAVLPYCLARAADGLAAISAESKTARSVRPMPLVEGGESIPLPKDRSV